MKVEIKKRLLSSIILLPLSFFCIIKGSFFFIFFLSICFILSIYEWLKISSNNLFKFLGCIYIFFAFYTVFTLRNSDFLFGLNYFIFILTISISTDIGGFLFGKILGGPKITRISPNKTYSGFFGSFILSYAFIFIIYGLNFLEIEFISDFNLTLYLYIFIISFIHQIGDLIVSYFKRLSNVKDSGKIIPGHGGILDRIDGMLFSFPTAFLIKFYFI